nr:hypothetical protein BaRGS_026265 [Batillaria attramentaria]
MVDGDFFEKLETVARTVRKSDQPFGGIQLIVCGDFLQLPPVAKGGTPRFCFQFVLDTLHGTEENHIERDGVLATRLCTHKEDVEKINKHRLASLSGLPVVKFVCGVTEVIKPSRWVFKMGMGMMVARRQIPLKLAWAISIHKSQGMTLDCVEISLARVFESGQTYVALSRAKSLEGLRVLNFDTSCVRANADVLRFYGKLQLTQKIMQPPKPATSSQQERTTNSTMILW